MLFSITFSHHWKTWESKERQPPSHHFDTCCISASCALPFFFFFFLSIFFSVAFLFGYYIIRCFSIILRHSIILCSERSGPSTGYHLCLTMDDQMTKKKSPLKESTHQTAIIEVMPTSPSACKWRKKKWKNCRHIKKSWRWHKASWVLTFWCPQKSLFSLV